MKNIINPFLFVIEGADDTGKTTLIEKIKKDKQFNETFKVRYLKFPSDELVTDFTADFKKVMENYFKDFENDIWIIDRYVLSHFIYQELPTKHPNTPRRKKI